MVNKVDAWLGPTPAPESAQLSDVLNEAKRSIAALQLVAEQLDGVLQDNRPAIKQFVQSGLPAATESLQELPALLRRLERVLAEFSQQPRETLFGGGKVREVEAKR